MVLMRFYSVIDHISYNVVRMNKKTIPYPSMPIKKVSGIGICTGCVSFQMSNEHIIIES